MRRVRILSVALIAFAAAPALFAAPYAYDEIATYGDGRLAYATLPNGPAIPARQVTYGILQILALPSGKVLATTQSSPSPPSRPVLNELRADGSLRQIGVVASPPYVYDFDEPVDLGLDSRGRLYLVTYSWRLEGNLPGKTRLVELDPDTAETLGTRQIDGIGAIAPAPEGLWTHSLEGFRRLDPDSGDMGPPVVNLDDFGIVSDFDVDSAGRLWFIFQYVCSPPCIMLGMADPETGLAVEAPRVLHEQTPLMHSLTIFRRCQESPTVRCLQGGRFRAEVSFEDYEGTSGSGRVAPARSGDSGLFYFFDPANWELMVKVLDGCAQNSFYWVFSSASTDVAYTLTLTDTQTGARKVYSNPLGQAARTVTDTNAFPCTAEPARNSP